MSVNLDPYFIRPAEISTGTQITTAIPIVGETTSVRQYLRIKSAKIKANDQLKRESAALDSTIEQTQKEVQRVWREYHDRKISLEIDQDKKTIRDREAAEIRIHAERLEAVLTQMIQKKKEIVADWERGPQEAFGEGGRVDVRLADATLVRKMGTALVGAGLCAIGAGSAPLLLYTAYNGAEAAHLCRMRPAFFQAARQIEEERIEVARQQEKELELRLDQITDNDSDEDSWQVLGWKLEAVEISPQQEDCVLLGTDGAQLLQNDDYFSGQAGRTEEL